VPFSTSAACRFLGLPPIFISEKEGRAWERTGHRFGLGKKLSLMLIACILLVSLGLVAITYSVYCRKVDSVYREKAERAANAVATRAYLSAYYVKHLREMIETDEFRQVHERAVAAGDEGIIMDWMRNQPPVWYEMDYYNADVDAQDDENENRIDLYHDYEMLLSNMNDARSVLGISSVYIQYVVDGVTYNLADPDESLFIIGTQEEHLDAFDAYPGNDRVPAIIYQFGDEWLCTACEPYVDGWEEDKALVGQVGVDINMSEVVRERHWFLFNSALFVVGLTLAAMVTAILLTWKLATKPLKLLAEGTMGFDMGEEGASRSKVIRLPIKPGDEIGDLYQEIQSMQVRIVDSAERLTKVAADRERVNTELGMAARIQASVLSQQFPDRPEFALCASMDPAKEVGGDFYDFYMLDDDHLALVIADVSDKGVPAALFMMSAKTILRYRARMGGGPGEILTSANAQLCKDNTMKMFVTVWMGILEISTGRLTCANAGHEYPTVRGGDGKFRVFQDQQGMVIGAMRKARYNDYTLDLAPGDAIFVYTDGVPEANDAAGEMYGMDRLEVALNRVADQSPEAILHAVRADVDAFVAGAKQFDDLTMLCLQYRGTPSEGEASI